MSVQYPTDTRCINIIKRQIGLISCLKSFCGRVKSIWEENINSLVPVIYTDNFDDDAFVAGIRAALYCFEAEYNFT